MGSPPPPAQRVPALPKREGVTQQNCRILPVNAPVYRRFAPLSRLGKGAGGLGRIRYRLAQGLRALLSPLIPLDRMVRDEALTILPVRAAAAFRALPKADQRHALRVYRSFIARGETDTDLLAAALLHDIGKHPGVGLTQRTVRVLFGRWPRLLVSLASTRWLPRRWRNGLTRLFDHAALGADLAASWGCTPATVAIIRTSHDADVHETVRRLQAMDDAS
jgi:hypothetical protein